jgi:hypothetical protein
MTPNPGLCESDVLRADGRCILIKPSVEPGTAQSDPGFGHAGEKYTVPGILSPESHVPLLSKPYANRKERG